MHELSYGACKKRYIFFQINVRTNLQLFGSDEKFVNLVHSQLHFWKQLGDYTLHVGSNPTLVIVNDILYSYYFLNIIRLRINLHHLTSQAL